MTELERLTKLVEATKAAQGTPERPGIPMPEKQSAADPAALAMAKAKLSGRI